MLLAFIPRRKHVPQVATRSAAAPWKKLRLAAALAGPALLALAGCAGGPVTAGAARGALTITPGASQIDTGCTGCNAASSSGAVQQFAATLAGSPAAVAWQVTGGDPVSGAGSINAAGQYTPPSYLTADRAQVVVTASLESNPAMRANTVLNITPGFLQPLTPENAAVGTSGSITLTGILAEAGGARGIRFALAATAAGTGSGLGTLGATNCQRSNQSFTSCTVTYTAPAQVAATGAAYIVATPNDPEAANLSKVSAVMLVNSAGVTSNPATHQGALPYQVQLGVSGGNNADYDLSGNTIVDCCSGTLGALLEDGTGRQYLLSNNHVLARSDHASVGDSIVQPGLIDNNCTPLGDGPGVSPVASLTGWLPLHAHQTNVDAAIAQVTSRAVDPSGSILELGQRQADGTLAAAPPGVSSSGGRGESPALEMHVAKSGRTTGLTCGGITALDLDVMVDYFLDCAETRPYLTRTFTHQIGVSGNAFSDAGDSGALLVDAATAEPVGLYFAGGTDAAGVSQAVASPAGEVLSELSAQLGNGSPYRFVGGTDHSVSCLNYGNSTLAAAQIRTLAASETARGQQALAAARMLLNPAAGILGVGLGKSLDRAGEAAILIYTDETTNPSVPAVVDGVRTVAIPTNARAVALGAAPQTPFDTASQPALPAAAIGSAIAVKQRVAVNLMKQEPAFFAVGVGRSLDNPREAALIVYVDRRLSPAALPVAVGGLRTRYVVMDRLHVTRSYAAPFKPGKHCPAHTTAHAE